MGILHLANELRLLRCTFTVSNGSLEQQEVEAHSDENGVNWAACLQHLVENIEAGEYFQALASRGVEALLWPGSAGAFKQGGSETENRAWFNSQKIRIKEFVSNQVNLHFPRFCDLFCFARTVFESVGEFEAGYTVIVKCISFSRVKLRPRNGLPECDIMHRKWTIG